jgi:hypothetical protein
MSKCDIQNANPQYTIETITICWALFFPHSSYNKTAILSHFFTLHPWYITIFVIKPSVKTKYIIVVNTYSLMFLVIKEDFYKGFVDDGLWRMILVPTFLYHHYSFGTRVCILAYWYISRWKSRTWVFSTTTSTCSLISQIVPRSHVWTSNSKIIIQPEISKSSR